MSLHFLFTMLLLYTRVADPYKAKLSAIPCRSHCKNRGQMISALHGLIYVSRRILRVNKARP